jgi:hypothetical protein
MKISYSFLVVTLLACLQITAITTIKFTPGGTPIIGVQAEVLPKPAPLTSSRKTSVTTTGSRSITTTVKLTTTRQTSTTAVTINNSVNNFNANFFSTFFKKTVNT